MVRTGGALLPSTFDEIKRDVPEKRAFVKELLVSCWDAAVKRDPDTLESFRTDAIIANPVSYGHIHIAEALSVPLHIFFTMPYSPTGAFPHPLAQLENDGDEAYFWDMFFHLVHAFFETKHNPRNKIPSVLILIVMVTRQN